MVKVIPPDSQGYYYYQRKDGSNWSRTTRPPDKFDKGRGRAIQITKSQYERQAEATRIRAQAEERRMLSTPKKVTVTTPKPEYAQNIKNWDTLSPTIKRKIARNAGVTEIQSKQDLYVIDNKGTLASEQVVNTIQKQQDRSYQQQKDKAIKEVQADLEQRFKQVFADKKKTHTQPPPTKKTGFEGRVDNIMKYQEGMAKRQEKLRDATYAIPGLRNPIQSNKSIPVLLPTGTVKNVKVRDLQDGARGVIQGVVLGTAGAADFIVLSSMKLFAAGEGLIKNTKQTGQALLSTTKEVPAEVVSQVKTAVSSPEELAKTVTAALVFNKAVSIGKTPIGANPFKVTTVTPVKATPTKPAKGQTTLKQAFKKVSKQNYKTKATKSKVTKQVNSAIKKRADSITRKSPTYKKELVRREQLIGRKLSVKEKRAVLDRMKNPPGTKTNTIVKDILKRQERIGRPLKSKEIQAIVNKELSKVKTSRLKPMKQKPKTVVNKPKKPTPKKDVSGEVKRLQSKLTELKTKVKTLKKSEATTKKPKTVKKKSAYRKKEVQDMIKAIERSNKKARGSGWGKRGQKSLTVQKLIKKAKPAKVARSSPKIRIRTPARVKKFLPVLPFISIPAALNVAGAVGLKSKTLEQLKDKTITKPAQRVRPAVRATPKVKEGTIVKEQQKLRQRSDTVNRYFTIAAAGALAVRARPTKRINKARQRNQRADFVFDKTIHNARRSSKGIYLPDLYAVYAGEKVTGKAAAKLLNPHTFFSGFEARPLIA
jgi:hypothetical protein